MERLRTNLQRSPDKPGSHMSVTVRVDIFSDMICPWCLIGYRRLREAADRLAGEIEVELHWLPFELNPRMPEGGMDRREYLEAKFGVEGAQSAYGRIARVLEEDGIDADVEAIRRTPSTLLAHRLCALAEAQDRGSAFVEELFRDFFRDGRDVGERSVLLDAAERCGMDREGATTWLDNGDGLDHVRRMQAEARRLGIEGVPFFIFDRRLALSGAQPVEVMCEVLNQAANEGDT
ncbi:MAG: DsbA family oxidoreductase [Geminicoccaceae bacterium]